ncbi:hypothetical protein [Nitrosopumilus sp.]|uniref:hypothetical protein n=1 Tax=Nitrosopumilus sp. TaxID=2024843 RepID=UPI002931A7EB|nr:hypothetical protein [Nitrosopumilus sp.]
MKYNDPVSVFVLEKLYRNRIIDAKHISFEDLVTGSPKHVRGNIKKKLKNLVKSNLVLQHPTSYGIQYTLNSKRLDDIRKILAIN